MSKEKMVPKIRFEDFKDHWINQKIGELTKIRRGASPRPISDPKWFDDNSEVGWVRISDVTEQDGRIHYLDQKLSVLGQEKTVVLEEPYLLLSIAASIGKPVINYIKTGIHDGFIVFYDSEFDMEFMYQWLEMFQPLWQRYGQPGSQVNLNSDLVRNQDINIPEITEQQKIGDLFEKLDQAISLQQQVLETTKEYKQSMLKKMFPKKGEKVPEIRFKGFSNAWMEYKLGKIADVSNGKMNTQDAIENGKYPFYIRSSEIKRSDKYLYNEEAILTPGEGKIGEVLHYVKGKYSAHQRVYRIFNFKNVDAIFILYHMSIHFKRHALKDNSQATAPSIRMGTLTSYPIRIPSLEEQQKIGSFFKTLDEKIEQEEKKLEIYESMKKALMQRMFV